MRITSVLALTALVALALPVEAQQAAAVNLKTLDDAVEITRLPDELTDAIRVPVPDRDSVNTALVFTHFARDGWAVVKCIGLNADGEPVGRAYTRIPPAGLRIIFASDLSNGVDVIGSVHCASRKHVVGSGFLLAPGGVSDLPTQQRKRRHSVRMHFPVVATY
ncbi:MAG: hypothetical protein HKP30_13220 [Myxococcales bacterium]|nr:hypothetical protein [Myxococcales bacterium]